jgi:hypothetical protein
LNESYVFHLLSKVFSPSLFLILKISPAVKVGRSMSVELLGRQQHPVLPESFPDLGEAGRSAYRLIAWQRRH